MKIACAAQGAVCNAYSKLLTAAAITSRLSAGFCRATAVAMWQRLATARGGEPRLRRLSSHGSSSSQGRKRPFSDVEPDRCPKQQQRSCGKTHGAAVSAGMARAQVKRAAKVVQTFTVSPDQDIVRIVFSTFGRGQSSAHTRKVYLS